MAELVFSPLSGCGVVYDGDEAVYLLDVKKMYAPEPAEGVHIAMWMQGPGDYRSIEAGSFPFREAYDEMSRSHQERMDALNRQAER